MDTLYHIANNDTGIYDVTNIDKLVQGSSGNMSTAKMGELHVKVRQVSDKKRLHIILPVKHCAKACADLF